MQKLVFYACGDYEDKVNIIADTIEKSGDDTIKVNGAFIQFEGDISEIRDYHES